MNPERYEDMVSESKLLELLERRFEYERLDFKERFEPRSNKAKIRLCKDIIAMANSGGGHLVFGVRDRDFAPVGLSDRERLDEADLRNTLDKYVSKRIRFFLAYHNLPIDNEQRLFGVLYVAPSPVPVVTGRIAQYQGDGESETAFREGRVLVRSGSRSRAATQEELGDLLGHPSPMVPSTHQLPEPPPTFRGRQDELDELTEAVLEGNVVISGLGGIGKTALALKLAQRLSPDYGDAQIYVDLRGTSSPLVPVDVMSHVVHAFHPGAELPASPSERLSLYRSVLNGKRAILLLDDAAGPDQIRPLLPPASCALLITSRQRFRLPGMRMLHLGLLSDDAAQALLREIAPHVGDLARELAEVCGYLPLTLELAASTLAERVDVTPAEYARRLRDEQRGLDLVDASLNLSYELLGQRLRCLWARLSVFSIPFDRETAGAVWEVRFDQTLEPLGKLLGHSLIEWREDLRCYEFHELARPLPTAN